MNMHGLLVMFSIHDLEMVMTLAETSHFLILRSAIAGPGSGRVGRECTNTYPSLRKRNKRK